MALAIFLGAMLDSSNTFAQRPPTPLERAVQVAAKADQAVADAARMELLEFRGINTSGKRARDSLAEIDAGKKGKTVGARIRARDRQVLSTSEFRINGNSHPSMWAEGNAHWDGATREYFNRAAGLKWRNRLGDWYDESGKLYGEAAFAYAAVPDLDREQQIHWDITGLVKGWLTRQYRNTGFLLRTTRHSGKRSGVSVFFTREADGGRKIPSLRITRAGYDDIWLFAVADTYLNGSTYKSLGKGGRMKVSAGEVALIKFDLEGVPNATNIQKAELLLHTTAKQYGASDIGVFRAAPEAPAAPPAKVTGIANNYPGDVGLGTDKQVVFTENFEAPLSASRWSGSSDLRSFDRVDSDQLHAFVPHSGKALRVKVKAGTHSGLNLRYNFFRNIGSEPEEIYFRYYLRLTKSWRSIKYAGKLPGIAGTYRTAGWGGRKSNGENGWSTRGHFFRIVPKGNPLGGRLPVGTYAYHADMKGTYGDIWPWTNGAIGALGIDRWYSVEQFVRLNSVTTNDGILRTWIDGRLAFEKTNIRFRSNPRLKIEEVWMNVYYGGKVVAPKDLFLYIDDVVIAKHYIGPMIDRAK